MEGPQGVNILVSIRPAFWTLHRGHLLGPHLVLSCSEGYANSTEGCRPRSMGPWAVGDVRKDVWLRLDHQAAVNIVDGGGL